MATENGRRDLRRLLFFSLGGVFVGLIVAGLTALLINNIIAPNRADSGEIADDSWVITFRLCEDAKWPDGTPITADDVVFSYNAVILNRDVGHGTLDEQPLPNDTYFVCEKVDDYVVRFTISAVSRPALNAMGFDIVAKNRLAEYIYTLNPELPKGTLSEMLPID